MELSAVLKLYDSPVNELQCWSICYGVCQTLIAKRREDDIRKEPIKYLITLDSLILTQRGDIEIMHSEPNVHGTQHDWELILAIGNLLCRCLDYGLSEREIGEVKLQEDLSELIGGMVLQNVDSDDSVADSDSLSSWESQRFQNVQHEPFKSLFEVITFCETLLLQNYNISSQPDYFLSVCKSFYIEASELKAFLGHVLHKLDGKYITLDQVDEREHKDYYITEWRKLWLEIMHELRENSTGQSEGELQRHDIATPPIYDDYSPYACVLLRSAEEMYSAIQSRLSDQHKCGDLIKEDTNAILDFIKEGICSNGDANNYNVFHRESSSHQDRKTEMPENDSVFNGDCLISTNDSALNGDCLRSSSDSDTDTDNDRTLSSVSNEEFRSPEFTYNNEKTLPPEITCNNNKELEGNMKNHLSLNEEISNTVQDRKFPRSRLSLLQDDEIASREDDINKIGSSLTEVIKIRQEITRSIKETTQNREVQNGNVCLGCQSYTFSIFKRARNCSICHQKYCRQCMSGNVRIPSQLADALPPNIDVSYNGNIYRTFSSTIDSLSRLQLPVENRKSNGVWLTTCVDCKVFLDTLESEKRKTKWKVRLQLNL